MIAPHTLSNFSYPPTLCQTSLTPPHFVKLSEFDKVVQPSLILHLSFTYPSLILRLLCAPHFVKLSEFDKVVQPSLILRHILGCASSSTILRHILGCASSPTFLRSTFAQPSLKVRPRWRKLAACAQFKIHNSKFIILPHSPLIFPLSSPYHSFKN